MKLHSLFIAIAVIFVFTTQNANAQNTALSALNRGDAAYEAGNYDLAIREYTEAIRLSPNMVSAYANRAIVYMIKGDWTRVITDLEAAINRIDQNNAEERAISINIIRILEEELKPMQAAFNRGLTAYNAENYDLAITEFTRVLEIMPSEGTFLNRGLAYGKKGDYEHAFADWTSVLAINPNNAEALRLYNSAIPVVAEISFNRAIVALQENNLILAITELDNAIKINQNYEDAFFARGVIAHSIRSYDHAIADFEAVLRINPNNEEARKRLGQARLSKALN